MTTTPEQRSANPEARLILRVLRVVDRAFSHFYHRLELVTPFPIPRTGPAILVCNHVSSLDPVLIQSISPRLIVWMMAKEYYEIPAMNWGFRAIEAIPVERRGQDMAATRSALRALESGRLLGVFPEGRIETANELLDFHTGAALLAIKSGAPIYPAYITGTQRKKGMVRAFLEPQKSRLSFGPELQIPRDSTSKEHLEQATTLIRNAIETLRLQTTPQG